MDSEVGTTGSTQPSRSGFSYIISFPRSSIITITRLIATITVFSGTGSIRRRGGTRGLSPVTFVAEVLRGCSGVRISHPFLRRLGKGMIVKP